MNSVKAVPAQTEAFLDLQVAKKPMSFLRFSHCSSLLSSFQVLCSAELRWRQAEEGALNLYSISKRHIY